ncbi:SDR family oxidoreductase [Fictibacillus sp. KIGAM418]|uniref:SDR family oxidoreductase n=1 Tax=Fictibacillus marinisediminis TaxID=2878389 RepID=A0A9X1XCT7_9BACL|nr:SDR family oxidoreductase [Fictibacillus marinisediminis]MCK6258258.1 SDR family oxidoreductase [Fictibacillus marinisediminis]
MKQQTALITGASSGIGLELAKRFARDGYNVVLVARNEQRLQTLKQELAQFQVQCTVHVKDLSTYSEAEALFQELQQQQTTVDFLVNNAGYGLFGEFTETDLQDELSMIDINIKALTTLTKLFLPGMKQRENGKILNVASTAAFQPGPLMAVYYATKAYVLSFSEALENEMKGSGVTVTALCPGPTKTGFESRANLGQSKLFKSGVMDVERVANIGYEGLMKGKSIVIPGFKNRLLANSIRFIPRKWVTATVRNVQGKS